MGIENRDYYRQAGWAGEMPPVCKYLIIVTVAVFLLQIFVTRAPRPEDLQALRERQKQWSQSGAAEDAPEAEEEGEEPIPLSALPPISILQEWFQLDTDEVVRHGQIWRLVTCAFCHERLSVWHILLNMLFLYWFGRMLEPLYGSREFLIFYLTAAVVASLCHIGLDLFTHHSVPAIGASGAVMAVVVLYAIHHPRETICIWFVPIEIRWLVLFYVIFDLHPVLLALAGSPMYTGVANAAHLGGAAFGFLYWKFNLRLEDYWNRLPRLRGLRRFHFRRHVRLYRPPADSRQGDIEGLVDKILEKIHEQGEASLTDVERDVLRIAGERYRSRSQG